MRISDWSSDVCSSDLLAVICKICVTEGVKKGANAKDAAIVAGVLEREGAHLLVLSGGMNVESPWAIFGSPMPAEAVDRKSVVEGKSVSVRVDLGGGRFIKKKPNISK